MSDNNVHLAVEARASIRAVVEAAEDHRRLGISNPLRAALDALTPEARQLIGMDQP